MATISHDRTTRDEQAGVAIWGGVECTVNRVGDLFFDQLERNGHAERLDDLRTFADLGIRTLRFPILWERTAPDGLENASWDWADERMELMRELGIRPIVGLVHHGSGPRETDLLDPQFPEKLAAYARAVAERYPWVDAYTPVNEPLTTARFSALYGFWYPHARNDRSFVQALLNECRATSMAMSAIREVNPSAELVQTEDLGKTHSSPTLRYQARFENHRRWLTFDLLCGDVDERHPLWKYLRFNLQSADALDWMRANPMPPDVIGVNYYLTSERYLDERLDRYPGCGVGGNRRHRYVDVEAIRVLADGIDGPERLIREAWDRYQIPIAVTEAHLGCVRVEQIRWFKEVLDAAGRLRANGVDLRAVTAWAMLGTYDWHCLVTRCEGLYEPGVFDVRDGTPRPTALAHMIRAAIDGRRFEHPLLDAPGWWRRPDRILYPAVTSDREPTSAEPGRFEQRAARPPQRRNLAVLASPMPAALHDVPVLHASGRAVVGSVLDGCNGHTNGNGASPRGGARGSGFAHGDDQSNGDVPSHVDAHANGNAHSNGHVLSNGDAQANGHAHANGHALLNGDAHSNGHALSNGHASTNGHAVANDAPIGHAVANGHDGPNGHRAAPEYPNGHAAQNGHVSAHAPERDGHIRPLLITGARGTLGQAFARVCRMRGIPYRLLSRAEMDIADEVSIERALDEHRPWAVVNAAGYVRVDDAEHEVELCMRENAEGPHRLATACARRGLPLTTFSSDLVFDGSAGEPYTERVATSPLNVYGRSKAEAERRVLEAHPSALVIRTSAFFGPWDEYNFVTLTLDSLERGEPVVASADITVSPTYVPDLVDEVLNLMTDGESGIWHLANEGATTWADLARIVAIEAGHDPALVLARPTGELGLHAPRPLYSPLASVRGALLPPLERAIERYFIDRRAHIGDGIDASARGVHSQA